MEIKTKLTVLGCYLKLKLGYQAKEAARWLLQFYQQQDDLEAVLDFYEEAFALNPEDETLLLECADFLYQRQQNSQAISLYKQIIAINPSIFLAHRNLGNLFIKQLRWQEAEQAYRKGIQLLNTPSVFIYRKLAKTLAQQQRWLDALSAYEKGWDDPHQIHQVLQGCNAEIQQGFETWETYLLLFQTLAEAKQWTGAIAAWWQAITLDPYQGWWRYE
ncbi:MAG: tetratricopeptide repeat protein, partial [Sodalinema sp.]|uniref:tetratricopeptide repeat protein n=1 Tax=Sodalinema sp. TaxID=3080550 RepID=UPI00396F444A